MRLCACAGVWLGVCAHVSVSVCVSTPTHSLGPRRPWDTSPLASALSLTQGGGSGAPGRLGWGQVREGGLFTSASDRFPASQPAPAACGPRGVSGPCGGRAADLSLETGQDGGTSKPLTPWGPGIGGCPPPALTLCSMSPRHSGGPGPTMGQLSRLCRAPQGLWLAVTVLGYDSPASCSSWVLAAPSQSLASLGLSYLGQQLMATFPRTFLKPLEWLGEALTGVARPPRDRCAALHLGSWGLPCPP